MRHLLWIIVLLVGVSFARAEPTTKPTTTRPTEMKVLSFNIRNADANDGDNAWPKRSELFFKTIRAFSPDLLGMQEVVQRQLDAAANALPEYDHVGVAREDGKQKGEYAPLFFKRDRFEKTDTGTWWLSPNPERVASVGWDAALTRIATWTRLRDKSTSEPLLVINTHFDHIGQIARHESAKLLREKIKTETGRVIITGDFNCSDGSDPINTMLEGGFLADAYRSVHTTPSDEEASFHAFDGTTKGKRIDFIFTHGFETIAATIDRTREGKRCPSDHDAVTATVK